MKTLIKSHDCNSCVAFKCNRVNSEFPKFRTSHKLSPTELAFTECTGYLCPNSWGIPLLMHLATDQRKVQALNDLLSSFGFQLEERTKYPYFKLLAKKARK